MNLVNCLNFFYRKGSKEERMRSTLVSIGPAVLNGGISTLIGIIMLITSESHVFISYFKVIKEKKPSPQFFIDVCLTLYACLNNCVFIDLLFYRYFSS